MAGDRLFALLSLIYNAGAKGMSARRQFMPVGKRLWQAVSGRAQKKSLIAQGACFLEGHILVSSLRWRGSFNYRDEGPGLFRRRNICLQTWHVASFRLFPVMPWPRRASSSGRLKKTDLDFLFAGGRFPAFPMSMLRLAVTFEYRATSNVIRREMGWPPWRGPRHEVL